MEPPADDTEAPCVEEMDSSAVNVTEEVDGTSPCTSAPSSPEQTEGVAAEKGWQVVAPSTLELHGDSHRFSYRQSVWEFSTAVDDVATVVELELLPSSGQGAPENHNAEEWLLTLTPKADEQINDLDGCESDRVVIPLPLVKLTAAHPPRSDPKAAALITQYIVDQALSLVGHSSPQPAATDPPPTKHAPLKRRVLLADHGVAPGRYLASLSVGRCQVGAGAAALKQIFVNDLSTRFGGTNSTLLGHKELLHIVEREAKQGQRWREWLNGSEANTISCDEVWPSKAGTLDKATVVSTLRAARVHSDCFIHSKSGIAAVNHRGVLLLQLPAKKDEIRVLHDRLLSTETHLKSTSGSKDSVITSALLCFDRISAKTFFFVHCVCLCLYQSSVSPLLMAVCVHSAGCLLNEMAACEHKWVVLEQEFARWSKQQQAKAIELADLPQLLSRDGPWRGYYEDCLSATRAQACRSSSQAAALALLLAAGMLAVEVFWSSSDEQPAMEQLLATAIACGAIITVLWMAAGLTGRVQDQSAHLYEIHKLAVEVIARELGAADNCNCDRAVVMNAKVDFELEYGLVKEFMTLNGAVDGYTILECRVTRSHAITTTTMVLSALAKELAELPPTPCTPAWLCVFAITCASACLSLAVDGQLWQSPAWMVVADFKELLAATRRVLVASCKQGTLAVVLVAVLVRAFQLYHT
eukprot:SAG31_NODE_161_length_21899_cov_16.832844_8_plen_697_part_00